MLSLEGLSQIYQNKVHVFMNLTVYLILTFLGGKVRCPLRDLDISGYIFKLSKS